MAADLLAIRRRCHAEHPDDLLAAEALFQQALRRLAPSDFLAYGLYVHGPEHPTLEALALSKHAQIYAELIEQNSRVLMVCPPEHGKTTLLRWYTEWFLGTETEKSFTQEGYRPPSAVFVSSTATQVEKRLMSIAATIEANRRFRQLFPHARPDKAWGWTKSVLYLKRPYPLDDPSLQGSGCPGPVQGARVNLVLVDDPVDQEEARSESVLQTKFEFHAGTLNDRLLEGAKQIDALTRWSNHPFDIAKNLLDSDIWRCEVMPALASPATGGVGYWQAHPEHGLKHEELWPALWPKARLLEKKAEKMLNKEIGSVLWNLAYLCDPVASSGNFFQRKWIKTWSRDPLEDGVEVVDVEPAVV